MSRSTSVLRATAPLAVLVLAAACADRVPTAPLTSARTDLSSVGTGSTGLLPGRYIVGVPAGGTLSDATLAAAGATVIGVARALDAVEVDAANPAALAGASDVRYVNRSFEFTLDVQLGDAVATVAPALVSSGPNAATAPWYANGVQWDMKAMKLDGPTWISSGANGVNVCIIDSGIDSRHQELTGKVVRDTSFVATAAVPSPAALDSNGHGTHVGSTVTGNGIVMASVAPAAKLMAAKVFSASGAGGSVVNIANAIVWCTDNGAHVMNLSLGGIRYFTPGTNVTTLSDVQVYASAVNYATTRGAVVVIAAGNNNVKLQTPGAGSTRQLTLPAQVPGTIAVGATGPLSRVGRWNVGGVLQTLPLAPPAYNPFDPQQVWPGEGVDAKAFYSNFGPSVDVFAPGGRGGVPAAYKYRIVADLSGTRVQQVGSPNDNIWAACAPLGLNNASTGSPNTGGVPGAAEPCAGHTDHYLLLAGTSMATPHVAGLAALLYGELGADRSAANRAKIESCLKSTADYIGPSTTYGGGRVNAQAALACVRSGAGA